MGAEEEGEGGLRGLEAVYACVLSERMGAVRGWARTGRRPWIACRPE